ncbi:MAG TPA: flagellar basal body P-ring protein FlgI [Tepidisphaeraceae bacterium]|jgi:flagellar P-ring protein precursor FlgI|nr:flagellar basal body P-ring protein FlgI [Tepidisphaeraceae bacterium]
MFKQTLIILAVLAIAPATSLAVKVADITRIGGQRTNQLVGIGLVYGLKGTGDGGDFLPAIRPLQAMLTKFANPAELAELREVSNVAVVSVTATVPKDGARDGDQLDVFVTSMGSAKSLRGGRLIVSPLQGPLGTGAVLALAQGAIVLEDPSSPVVGKIPGGCVMEADLPSNYIDNGRFTLIIEDPSASWTISSTIAKIINDAEGNDGEILATAIDPKNIIVSIPEIERERPDSFISRVQRLPVPLLPTEARVQINDRTGTLIITGDVEISPVVISHKGLTISTISPTPVATPRTPILNTRDAVALDTTNTGGAKLQDLVDTLDKIKVPAEDRITIVKELFKTGKLHAKLIVE